MRSVLLPGEPQPKLQAVSTGEWQRKRIITYVSGTALAILADADRLLQTIYHDRPLSAVTFDEASGIIACSSEGHVYIYAPNGRSEDYLQWNIQSQVDLPPEDGHATALSWGLASELLVGSRSLALYSLSSSAPRKLWHRSLANPVKLAVFCPDVSLAASVGDHDKLVKVWRRISIGSEDVQFDHCYLPHPRGVVRMHWRERSHPEESIDNVLYTIAADQVLRVWAPVWPHETYVLQLWASVDLQGSVPGSLGTSGGTGVRGAFVLDSRVLALAAENAVASVGNGEKERETLQTLVEVVRRCPEVVVVFDSRGKMSAWGLENVGCRTRKTTTVFPIVHEESTGIGEFERQTGEVQFLPWAGGRGLVVLAHLFDGRICWLESRLDRLLDPKPRNQRFLLRNTWSGHRGTIDTLVRTVDGRNLLSSTEDNEHILWQQSIENGTPKLTRKSFLRYSRHAGVRWAVVLESGRYIMTLHADHVVLWDTQSPVASEVERCAFTIGGDILCLLLLPETADERNCFHVVAVSSEMTGIAWEVRLPMSASCTVNGANGYINGTGGPSLREFATFDLGPRDGLLMLVPVDPVGWNATLSENLDIFSREVAISLSKSGLLRSWTVKVSPEDCAVKWLATSTVNTGIENPSLAKGSSIKKVAVVDATRSELTIWDSMAGQLEYRKEFDAKNIIRDLDWTSTPQSQSILAVGFPHRVLLMCQLRYDYLNAGPAWAPFREINIRDATPHPIGDSIWLSEGGLVIGSGNQLFVYPRKIDEVDDILESLHLSSHQSKLDDVFAIVCELNGPLPVYHPQFLQQAILSGKTSLVETILVTLYKELRDYHEEIGLDNLLNIPIETFYVHNGHEGHQQPRLSRRASKITSYFDPVVEDEIDSFDSALAEKLCDLIKRIPIPHLTGTEQIALASTVECVAQTNEHRRSIDENGARYLLFFRQHTLRKNPNKVSRDLGFRDISWAFHSDSQEILVDLVNRNSQNRMLWPQARESGIFMWLRDDEAVKRQWEALARNTYTQTDEKNPVDCSLHYLALRKKNVLTGLWRMAGWNREQAGTMKFLSNNFNEPRWRTAALKNAYALMGKHRFEYAAAFFLLADALKDACNVILNQLRDPQLAIAVARVYEPSSPTTGAPGPVLTWLLQSRILPLAAETGDRWLATWAFWMLGQKDAAVRALLEPLDALIPAVQVAEAGKTFLADDPALAVLYGLVREKTLQARRGAEAVRPGSEWAFVLRTARVLDRMGCDLLALDLIKNWQFLPAPHDVARPLIQQRPGALASPGMRRRRSSSFTVLDLPSSLLHRKEDDAEQKEEGAPPETPGSAVFKKLAPPPQAVFEEPDMSHFDF